MKLFMDESGNGLPSQPLIVGAVETGEDSEEIERRIQELYRRLSARMSLQGMRGFEDFRKHGFHASADPVEISGPFLELMQDLSFKAYIWVTDRSNPRAGDSEIEKIGYMYEMLLGDLFIRHRKAKALQCYVEQGASIKELVLRLPDAAGRRARDRLGRRVTLPQLNISVVSKTEAMSLAIIDYMMMAVSRWIRSGFSTNPADRIYRAFREVEPFISVLYSLEQGTISNRKKSLH